MKTGIKQSLVIALLLSLTSLANAADKPNILVIWGDDVG